MMTPAWWETTLDCQDCGQILKILNQTEERQVATNPYNFVVYCARCKKEREQVSSQN